MTRSCIHHWKSSLGLMQMVRKARLCICSHHSLHLLSPLCLPILLCSNSRFLGSSYALCSLLFGLSWGPFYACLSAHSGSQKTLPPGSPLDSTSLGPLVIHSGHYPLSELFSHCLYFMLPVYPWLQIHEVRAHIFWVIAIFNFSTLSDTQ